MATREIEIRFCTGADGRAICELLQTPGNGAEFDTNALRIYALALFDAADACDKWRKETPSRIKTQAKPYRRYLLTDQTKGLIPCQPS